MRTAGRLGLFCVMRSDAEEKSQGREGDDQLQGSAGPGFHLLALRWRDVDFERRIVRVHRTYKSGNGVDTPKSGRGRAVPMADEVAQALARLGEREHFTEDDDLVFRGPRGHVNAQKLGYRYKAALERAGLRELRFHDLRTPSGRSQLTAPTSSKCRPGWATRT